MSARKADGFLDVRDAALARLSAGPLPPVTVIAGEVPFVKERLIEAAAAVAGGQDAFAPAPGESDAAACRRLLDEWRTANLFGGGRLIVARGADRLFSHGRLAWLEEALEGGDPPHRLLLTVEAFDGRTKLAKRLKESGALLALPPLRDAPPPWHAGGPFLETDLNLWIRDEAVRAGLKLDLAAADELGRRVGNEPAALSHRLEQLVVLLGTGRPVRPQDIARHVRRSSARLLALFDDALRAGDARSALDLLDRMLSEGVYDHLGRLVSGDEAVDTLLRGLSANLARVLEAHEALGDLRPALDRKPWQRSEEETRAIAAVLGAGGRRVFLERDVKATRPDAVRAAFGLALSGLRALRDGRGVSMHALTVRLARAFAAGAAPAATAVPAGGRRPAAGRGPARAGGWS